MADYIPYNPQLEQQIRQSLKESINRASEVPTKQIEQQSSSAKEQTTQSTQSQISLPSFQEIKKDMPNMSDDEILAKYYQFARAKGINVDPVEFWKLIGYKPKYQPTIYDEIRLSNPKFLKYTPEDIAQKLYPLKEKGYKFEWDELNKAKDYKQFLDAISGPSKLKQEIVGGAKGLANLIGSFFTWAAPMAAKVTYLLKKSKEKSVFPEVNAEMQRQHALEAEQVAQEVANKLRFENKYPGYTGTLAQEAENIISFPFEFAGEIVNKIIPYEEHPLLNTVGNLIAGLVIVKSAHFAGSKILGKKEVEVATKEPIKDLDEIGNKAAEALKESIKKNPNEEIFTEDNPLKPVEEEVKKNPDMPIEEIKQKLDGIAKELSEDDKIKEEVKQEIQPEAPTYTLKDLLAEEGTKNAEQKSETGEVYEGMPGQGVQEEGSTTGETVSTDESGERVGIERPESEPVKVAEEGKPEEVKAEEGKTEKEPWEMTREDFVYVLNDLKKRPVNISSQKLPDDLEVLDVQLTGSRARGDARPTSDSDYFVYVNKNLTPMQENYLQNNFTYELSKGEVKLYTSDRSNTVDVKIVQPKHRRWQVFKALPKGKPIPPEILKDYPDLAEKYGVKIEEKPLEEQPWTQSDPGTPEWKALWDKYRNQPEIQQQMLEYARQVREEKLPISDDTVNQISEITDIQPEEIKQQAVNQEAIKDFDFESVIWKPVEDYRMELKPGDWVKYKYVDKRGKVYEGIGVISTEEKVGRLKTGFVYKEIISPEGKKIKMPWSSKVEYFKANINEYPDLMFSGGPDTIETIKKIRKEIEDSKIPEAAKEDLNYHVNNLHKFLLPSYVSLKNPKFRFIFDNAVEFFLKKKAENIDKWLSHLDSDGLMTTISQDAKLEHAFNEILFSLDDHSQALSILEKKAGISPFKIGDEAERLMQRIAEKYGLTSDGYGAVRELYQRWFDAKNQIYKEIVQNLKDIYEDRISKIDNKIQEIKDILQNEKLEEEERIKLEKRITKLEVEKDDVETEYERKLNEIGFIKYYAPHVWEPSNKIFLVIDKNSGEVVYRGNYSYLKRIGKDIRKEYPSSQYEIKVLRNIDPNMEFGNFEQSMSLAQSLLRKIVDKAIIPEEIKQELFSIQENWLKSRGFMQRFMERKGVGGYIRDKGIEVITKYLSGYEGSKVKREFIAKLAEMPKPSASERSLLLQYSYNLVRNENLLDIAAGKIKSFLFFKYLGFKPNAPLRNLTQPYLMTAPDLKMQLDKADIKAGYGDVLKNIAKAQKQSIKLAVDIMKSTNSDMFAERIKGYNWLTEEEKAALVEAYKKGFFKSTAMQEWSGKSGAEFKNAWRKFVELSGTAFHWSDVSNRITTFLSDYRFFHDLDHAAETIYKTQFIYNKVDMPVVMGSGTFGANLARTAYTFMSYPLNELRLWKELIDNKAYYPLAASILSFALIGGASAVPVVAFLKALYTKATGTDLDEKLRQELNPTFYRIVETGLPSLLGIDLSTQFGFSLPFMNNYAMTYNDDLTEYVLRNLGGAFYNTWKQADFAWKSFKIHDWRDFIIQNPATPRALANLLNAYFAWKYGIRTKGNFPIWVYDKKLKQIKLNSFELIAKALGFQPVKLSEYYTHKANKSLLKQHYQDIKTGLILETKRYIADKEHLPQDLINRIRQYNLDLYEKFKKGYLSYDEYKNLKLTVRGIRSTIKRESKRIDYINIPLKGGK